MPSEIELLEKIISQIDASESLAKTAWIIYTDSRSHTTTIIKTLNLARTIIGNTNALDNLRVMEYSRHLQIPEYHTKILTEINSVLKKSQELSILIIQALREAELMESKNRVLYEKAELITVSYQRLFDESHNFR